MTTDIHSCGYFCDNPACVKAQRDEMREYYVPMLSKVNTLQDAARALVERWDTPLWKDAVHTGVFIDNLRKAIDS